MKSKIIDYDKHSTDMVKITNGKLVSIHDLICYYNQIQIMKAKGTYPKDFEFSFECEVEVNE